MFKRSEDNLDWNEILEQLRDDCDDFQDPWIDLESDDVNSLETQLEFQINARDELYTSLLGDYRDITKKRNNLKEWHKWVFFWLIISGGFYIITCIGQIMHRIIEIEEIDVLVSAIPVLITAFVALLSSIITIPLTVTRFLFNEKEDVNITQTIHKTQAHDETQIKRLLDLKKMKTKLDSIKANELKESSNSEDNSDSNCPDDPFEESVIELTMETPDDEV